MIDSKRVLAFGLGDTQIKATHASLAAPPYAILQADSYRQIVDTNYFAVIINHSALTPEGLAAVMHFLTEIDGQSTVKIVLSANAPLWKKATNAQVFANFEALLPNLAALLEKAHARARRAEILAKNMNISHFVWQLIGDNPGISTAAISEKIHQPGPVVRRYIEELRLSGQPIAYDPAAKGWLLFLP